MTARNPYEVKKPVENIDMLFGRESTLHWLIQKIQIGSEKQVIAINGLAGTGKSSILLNLPRLIFEDRADLPIFLHVDAREINNAKSSESTWRLVKSLNRSLADQSLGFPSTEKPNYVLQPESVFLKEYWTPLRYAANDRRLLLTIDNLELLSRGAAAGQELSRKRNLLWTMFESAAKIDMVVALKGRPEIYSPEDLSPFLITTSHRLQNLSYKETTNLIRVPDEYEVPDYVCDFIFVLTSGQPADVQLLAHQLYDRMVKSNYNLVTIADILAILSSNLKPSDFNSPVYLRRQQTTMVFSNEIKDFKFVNDLSYS